MNKPKIMDLGASPAVKEVQPPITPALQWHSHGPPSLTAATDRGRNPCLVLPHTEGQWRLASYVIMETSLRWTNPVVEPGLEW